MTTPAATGAASPWPSQPCPGYHGDGSERGAMRALRKFLYEDSLSVLFAGLFVVFLAGQVLVGYMDDNQTLTAHGKSAIGFGAWLGSGTFLNAMFVDWQAALLQLAVLVLAGGILHQIGASHSRDPKKDEQHGAAPNNAEEAADERRLPWLRRHSLSVSLVVCFVAAFVLHVFAGISAFNEERALSNEPAIGLGLYLVSARFWFENFQTWEAEFIAILLFLVFSIFLREQRSAESKLLSASDTETGETND